jgi:hypothetical protein
MKSLEIYENYITLFCLEFFFFTIFYLLGTMHGVLTKMVELIILCKQQLRNNTILFCHVLCLGMHSNVTYRFMLQAF